ncbi:helix-turn-helix domain-containing protein [Propioniciclava sp.]|uniref:helix-turn-helix domain-containing protein n=1 Tax=Propioniciclava sp. TaxID=2038686 RepID=UPI0039E35B21
MSGTSTKRAELSAKSSLGGAGAEAARVGATIKHFREARGMTQEDLSRAALLSRPYVANVEAGRKRPSVRAVARIAAALRVPQIALIAESAGVAP